MKKSLTLIEVLIAAALFAGLSIALYSLMTAGIKTRQHFARNIQSSARVMIAFERFRQDCASAFELFNVSAVPPSQDFNFIGEPQRLEFHAVTRNYQKNVPQIRTIGYYYQDNVVYRSEKYPFSETIVRPVVFLDNIQECRFFYYESTTKKWEPAWGDLAKIPLGVKMVITLQNPQTSFEKYVYIDRP